MNFSVLLSVCKNERSIFLSQALESIWDDQVLMPEQVVLVQDGSLPLVLNEVIAQWQCKLGNVLTIVPLEQNMGLGAALNEGLKYCRHELVARMDTDDVALPERFSKQVIFMQSHPDVMACSAQLEEWNSDLTRKIDVRKLPCDSPSLANFARRRSPLSHPLAMFRKQAVKAVGGYPPLRKGQDYGLWSLLLVKGYKLANLPEVLLKMRTGNDLYLRRGWQYFKYEFQLLQFQRRIGFLNHFEFATNVLVKVALRLSPTFLKRLAYKQLR